MLEKIRSAMIIITYALIIFIVIAFPTSYIITKVNGYTLRAEDISVYYRRNLIYWGKSYWLKDAEFEEIGIGDKVAFYSSEAGEDEPLCFCTVLEKDTEKQRFVLTCDKIHDGEPFYEAYISILGVPEEPMFGGFLRVTLQQRGKWMLVVIVVLLIDLVATLKSLNIEKIERSEPATEY